MPSKDLEGPTLANGHELTRHTDGKLHAEMTSSQCRVRTKGHYATDPRARSLYGTIVNDWVIIARSGILSDMIRYEL